MSASGSEGNQKTDLVSALVSNFGSLAQIVAVSLVGLSESFGLTKVFISLDILKISNFFIFIISLTLISVYTFYKNNSPLILDIRIDKSAFDKKILKIIMITNMISMFAFLLSTYLITQVNLNILCYWIVGFVQVLSYSIILILGTLALYVWMRDIFSKQGQFNQTDLLPNLLSTIRSNGYLKEPSVKIKENIYLSNSNRLVTFEINEIENNIQSSSSTKRCVSLVLSFDGKTLIKEVDSDERKKIMGEVS